MPKLRKVSFLKISMTFACNSNILVAENTTGTDNDASSQLKITIRPSSGTGQAQQLSLSTTVNQPPSRVQPSRTNKANKMAKILDEMDVDDDATTCLPGRRKRRIEDDPEQFSIVPDNVGRNPMAPVKRRKQDPSVRPLDIPSQLPLQPVLPEQIPPSRSFQPQTQPPQSVAPQVQRQYQAQPVHPQGGKSQYQARQSDQCQTQTLPDNEVHYLPQPEVEQPPSVQTGEPQPHPSHNTAMSIDGPRLKVATDQPQMDRQPEGDDGHYDGFVNDDQYQERDSDIYSTPRHSNYRPQRLSQSPGIRAEGLFTHFSIFINLSIILIRYR